MQCCEERIISMMKEIMSKIINKIRDNKIIFFLRYSKMDRKQTFNYIYSHKKWGGGKIENKKYYSGQGSHEEKYVQPYIMLIKEMIKDDEIKSILDLGCGDFNVGKAIMEDIAHVKYVGVDIVQGMIDELNKEQGSDNIEFTCLDIVDDDLPDADLCLIRQVLQHLDNGEIQRILSKLSKYKYVVITEHITEKTTAKTYNRDKVHGQHARIEYGSGVYLEETPFCLDVKTLLRVPYGDGKTELVTVEIV